MKTFAQNWINTGIGFFYPEICQLCQTQRAMAKDGFVCAKCWSQVRFIRPPFCERCGLPFEGEFTTEFECSNCREIELHFSSARSAVVAKSIALEAIHRFKYQRALWFENFLADLFLREAVRALHDQPWNFIAPVPLHSLKKREREFNQAECLARHLGDALKIPVNIKLLRRVMPTTTQTVLTREQRAKNMRGAFAVRKRLKLCGASVILVDDVFTTGATTNACAKVLRAAGAGDVCVWTVARGL
ncbi:MAG: ComF family protein [Limisphaerales bacterium]